MDGGLGDEYKEAARQRSVSGENPQSNIQSHLSHLVWEAGSKQVKETFNTYGRIDIFRPYFDVEPKQVRRRLIHSLIPKKPSQMAVSIDMYGPSMIVLTLVALLLFSMKSSGYVVKDGTLMGTAFLTCFGAWVLISLIISSFCYFFKCDANPIHIFSLFGYSLFSHCIVICVTSIFHPSHNHLFFYSMMILFCVPSALRVILYLSSKTREKTDKMVIAACVIILHLGYLCYLHFGFHVMVEEIDEILKDSHLSGMMMKAVSDVTGTD